LRNGGKQSHHRLPCARLHDLCEGSMEFTLVGGVHHLSLLNRPPQRVKNRPAPSVSSSPALYGAPLLRRKAGRDRSRARKAEWPMTDCRAVAGNRSRQPSAITSCGARRRSPSGCSRMHLRDSRWFCGPEPQLTAWRLEIFATSQHKIRALLWHHTEDRFRRMRRHFGILGTLRRKSLGLRPCFGFRCASQCASEPKFDPRICSIWPLSGHLFHVHPGGLTGGCAPTQGAELEDQ